MKELLFSLLLGFLVGDLKAEVDWAKRADREPWNWPSHEPTLLSSTIQMNEPYEVVLGHLRDEQFTLRILRNDQLRLKLNVHATTVFARIRDTFVYAEFSPYATGCTIVAFNLETKERLWSVPLEGIGPIAHFGYTNRVSLNIAEGAIVVYGWESAGKYLEYLDLTTGKVLGHHIYEKGFK